MHKIINNLIDIQKEINLKNFDQKSKTKIIAVSKTFSLDKIMPLIDYGHLDYGENKVQEALIKWSEIKLTNKNLNLHMIGKLQTNKVKTAVGLFDYIHSLDSIKLAEKISEEQKKINKNLKIFIQVNIGEETQKNGISINELKNFYEICLNKLNLNIIGLMCLPPISDEPSKYFQRMKQINDNLSLNELSMGMSSDYLLAIKYGASFVRIGSKIFGMRN